MKQSMFLACLMSIACLFSCEKTEKATTPTNSANNDFAYSKSMIISDADGNSATIRIQTHSQKALDDHQASVFELKTYTELPPNNHPSPSEPSNTEEDDEFTPADVLVEITAFTLKEGVVGFDLKSSLEKGRNNTSAFRAVDYHYEYGANGVRGVRVTYIEKFCNNEYLKVKLSKKTSSNNWFWQQLGKGTLREAGDQWGYLSAAAYAEYRLKVDAVWFCNSTYKRVWLP